MIKLIDIYNKAISEMATQFWPNKKNFKFFDLDDKNDVIAIQQDIFINKIGDKIGQFYDNDIYRVNMDDGTTLDILFHKNIPILVYNFIMRGNSILEKAISKKRSSGKDLAKKLISEFYFDKFNTIISDNLISKQGLDVWLYLIKYSFSKGHKAALLNNNCNIIEEMTPKSFAYIIAKNYDKTPEPVKDTPEYINAPKITNSNRFKIYK